MPLRTTYRSCSSTKPRLSRSSPPLLRLPPRCATNPLRSKLTIARLSDTLCQLSDYFWVQRESAGSIPWGEGCLQLPVFAGVIRVKQGFETAVEKWVKNGTSVACNFDSCR